MGGLKCVQGVDNLCTLSMIAAGFKFFASEVREQHDAIFLRAGSPVSRPEQGASGA